MCSLVSAAKAGEEAVGGTCACSGGSQTGTENGDKVCQWRGGNCSKFREGCDKYGATICTMQKSDAEKAVADDCWWTGDCEEAVARSCSHYTDMFGSATCKNKDCSVYWPHCSRTCCEKANAEQAVAESQSTSSSESSEDGVGHVYSPCKFFGENCEDEEEEVSESTSATVRSQMKAASLTTLAFSETKDTVVGPPTVVKALALVGFLATLWGAACHFLKN